MTEDSKNKKLIPRSLIMHIGLPKTGTTMIQEFFKFYHKKFEENGIGVLTDGKSDQHYLLGHYLLELDGHKSHLKEYFLQADSLYTNYYPDWTNQTTYVISSENMKDLGERGVLSVMKYAQEAHATLKVVLTIRKPSEYLFSCWSQMVKNEYIDWIEFIEVSIRGKSGFLSSSLQQWLIKDQVASIVIVKYERVDLLNNFLRRIGIDRFISPDEISSPLCNVSGGIVEVLYQATMVRDIYRVLASNNRLNFTKPDFGYIQRMLLDVADNASPVYEIAKKYEDEIMNDGAVLGSDSYESLSKYSKAWSDDAKQFLQVAKPWLDAESIKIIKKLAEEALVDAKRFINDSETCRKLPQKDFVEKLPIDSQFIGLTRTLATSLLLGNKAFNRVTSMKDEVLYKSTTNLSDDLI